MRMSNDLIKTIDDRVPRTPADLDWRLALFLRHQTCLVASGMTSHRSWDCLA